MTVIVGECVEAMNRMEPCSVSAIVTDPPYGLEFMGKEWDKLGGDQRQIGDQTFKKGDARHGSVRYGGAAYGQDAGAVGRAMQEWHERWARAALRVLRPGGYLLAFGGTRTVHRMACAIEDAGFEIRDRIVLEQQGGGLLEVGHATELAWMYGSGFPKSHDVSKAIDKAAGAEREVIRERSYEMTDGGGYSGNLNTSKPRSESSEITAPASEEAKRWEGWGTALKPAYEPIIVARKPLVGTVAQNILAYDAGGLNIDACRLTTEPRLTGTVSEHAESGVHGIFGKDVRTTRQQDYDARQRKKRGRDGEVSADRVYKRGGSSDFTGSPGPRGGDPTGRWPANVMLVHSVGCVCVGTKRVKVNGPDASQIGMGEDGARTNGIFGAKVGKITTAYVDADGMEEVESWECVNGCPVRALDAQTGMSSPKPGREGMRGGSGFGFFDDEKSAAGKGSWPSDPGGGASRFFYTAKSARSEREAGLIGKVPCSTCDELDSTEHETDGEQRSFGVPLKCRVCEKWKVSAQPCVCEDPDFEEIEGDRRGRCIRNDHPTVKPIDVMRWLVRLVVPPGGVVCDPFMGSGTTGVAAVLEGFEFVGVERDERSALIAETRIGFWQAGGEEALNDLRAAEARENVSLRKREAVAEAGQLDLLGTVE